MLTYCVVVPAHNEEAFLSGMLDSLLHQTHLPTQIVIVNDNSTDTTEELIDWYCSNHPIIRKLNRVAESTRLPGSKVVAAFHAGVDHITESWDFLVKLDADLILPEHYFQSISEAFESNPKLGIAGGFAYEEQNGVWALNHTMNKDHVRGAFKSYTRECFTTMGGLRSSMGWDTIDELLARYYGFEVLTLESLHIKHLRPTASSYSKKAKYMQGEAMYKMRYDPGIAFLTMAKASWKQKKASYFVDSIIGYAKAHFDGTRAAVSPEEGKFIRKYRWQNILAKITGK
ncbi:glycosyl transferase family 2 [Echinicola pacifica]|uniref:Glycosyl transferase family 2 n=1 Tax=Echinicola pacifica TaxID=346377 RepID=A0A918Q1R1_9BACT|nr:glycosyltransferase family 2 protein [Echinicola pacifica]GGZ30834.1 glycosyl transferase family 2 [Echinicola pacifica]